MQSRLREIYEKNIVPELIKEFGYKNSMEVPKLSKIVLNMGVGEAVSDKKKLDAALAGREEEIRKSIQDDIEAKQKEAEEMAKLSEAEKFQKELDKVKQQLAAAEKKNAIADREKALDKYIKEKGYDRDAILEFVDVSTLPDTFQDRIDSINDKLQERVNAAVNERLKDVDEKVLGHKGGKDSDGVEFNFDFQSRKPNKK